MAPEPHGGRNRFYSPALGRWINRDPIGIAGGLNLYGAMGNSPVNDTDPYGLSPGDAIGIVGVGISWGEAIIAPSPVTIGWALLDTITEAVPLIPGTSIRHGAKLTKLLNRGKAVRNFTRGALLGVSVTSKGWRKADYIFSNKNTAMNWARKQLGRNTERMYNNSGKWIGWVNDKGEKLFWGHDDWITGPGMSKFPHLNYKFVCKGSSGEDIVYKGHLFLEDKIKGNKLWDEFVDLWQ
jgi:uncharacterized protein RhaS with RHS repeats